MEIRQALRVAAFGVVAMMLITGCAPATPAPGASQGAPATESAAATQAPAIPAGGTAQVRVRGAIGTLEVTTKQLNVNGGLVAQALYDTLLALDADTAEPIPYLAKSFTQSPTEMAFTLRTDATCADGTPVTATVVKNSLDAFIKSSPGVATSLGAGPFTVVANDAAATVTVTSKTPNTEMIYGFTYSGTGIVCPAGLVDTTQQLKKSFGSGPFVIESFNEGDAVTVKVRPEWKWGPKGTTATTAGFPDKIVFKIIDNETTAANLLVTGGLDVGEVSGPDVARLLADKSLTNRQQSNSLASPLLLQMNPGRVSTDEAVREAVMTALDPEEYNKVAYLGRGRVPTGGFLVKGARCYDESLGKLMPQHSVAKAKQVLAAAGYTESGGKFSKGGKPLAIQVLGQQLARPGAEYISETLNAAGFAATVNIVDAAQFSTLVRNLSFDVTQLTIGSQTSTWGGYLPFLSGGKLVTEGGVNRTNIFDPAIDAAYANYLSATSAADACKFMSEFQRRILEKHLIMPMVASSADFFAKNFAPYTVAWQIRRTAK